MIFSEFISGIRAYGRAIRFIQQHSLYRAFLIPIIILAVLFSLLFVLAAGLTIRLNEYLEQEIPKLDFWGIGAGLISMVALAISLILIFYVCRILIQIVFAPVNSWLSEITENIYYGRQSVFPGWKAVLGDVIRSVRLNLRNFFLEAILTLVLLLIPVLNTASPLLIFLVQSYFSGFNYLDYTLERRRMNIPEGIRFVRSHSGLSLGLGSVYSVLLWIPVLGWVMAPILATVAASLTAIEALDKPEAA